MQSTDLTHLTKDPDWWRGAVIYQIYPRSFQDANNDGVGDLRGIINRLDYIASLGVDAIWISPFFTSPMKDFGYDVSNYRDVDPMFGTLADFAELVQQAHARNIKVMIDLVMSHSSDQHPWFVESRASADTDKSDWYVWADGKPDGSLPNNWLSIFGGPAWEWDETRQKYYLHNFLVSQPDLNFHNMDVQDALLDVSKFWLDLGVDGFRLDTINFYVHDKELRDNPPLPEHLWNAKIAPLINPYNHQEHLYDKNRPENLDFLRKLRALMNDYNAAAVGEVGDAQRGLELLGEYTAGDDLMHMCYAFEFLSSDLPTAKSVVEVLTDTDRVAADGWPCWAYSNHDTVRHPTRWNMGDAQLRLINTLMMCLRGSACIYQGEELGMPESELQYEDLQDPYGIEFWPEFKGRDGCRTPMMWDEKSPHAGFGTHTPWLPVNMSAAHLAVDAQEADSTAILHHYRRAIALRTGQVALAKGTQTDLQNTGDLVTFKRTYKTEEIFCAFNLSNVSVDVAVPAGAWENVADQIDGAQSATGNTTTLNAWQFCILKKEST